MVKSEAMLEVNAVDNAINYLEMIDHFLTTIDSPWKWKWISIATHQALYSFAICALSGTAPSLTVVDRKHKAGMVRVRWVEGQTDSDIASKLNITQERLQALKQAPIRIISIHKALERLRGKDYLPWANSLPLQVNDEEEWALNKLIVEFRNDFEHFMPKTWIIDTSGFPTMIGHVLRVIEFIALESNCITYTEPEFQVTRIRSVIGSIHNHLDSLK